MRVSKISLGLTFISHSVFVYTLSGMLHLAHNFWFFNSFEYSLVRFFGFILKLCEEMLRHYSFPAYFRELSLDQKFLNI